MKHIVWVRYILMIASVLAIVIGWTTYGRGEAAGDAVLMGSGVNTLLMFMYVILGVGIAAMILMSIFALMQNPKAAGRSLIGLVLVLIVVGVAWVLSSAEAVVTPTETYADATMLKVADTSLYAMYACLFVAIATIVVLEIRNAFK